jgi:hypothetical protein
MEVIVSAEDSNSISLNELLERVQPAENVDS